MLLPDPYVLWAVALVVVVVTRDFHSILAPVIVFQSVVWLTSGASSLPSDEQDAFVARRIGYLIMGAFSGLALAAAIKTREMIPSHTFHKNRAHFAAPVASFVVGHGTYFVAVAAGLTSFFPPDGPDRVFFWIVFSLVMLVSVIFLIGIVLTWMGWDTPVSFRYRDSGIKVDPHPPARVIVEFFASILLILSTFFFWIYFSADTPHGLGLSQWIGGLISLFLQAIGWYALYRLLGPRYRMNATYFSTDQSYVGWGAYVATLGVALGVSGLVYLIAAIFATTGFHADLIVGSLTIVVLSASVGIWLALERPSARSDTYSIVNLSGTDDTASTVVAPAGTDAYLNYSTDGDRELY